MKQLLRIIGVLVFVAIIGSGSALMHTFSKESDRSEQAASHTSGESDHSAKHILFAADNVPAVQFNQFASVAAPSVAVVRNAEFKNDIIHYATFQKLVFKSVTYNYLAYNSIVNTSGRYLHKICILVI